MVKLHGATGLVNNAFVDLEDGASAAIIDVLLLRFFKCAISKDSFLADDAKQRDAGWRKRSCCVNSIGTRARIGRRCATRNQVQLDDIIRTEAGRWRPCSCHRDQVGGAPAAEPFLPFALLYFVRAPGAVTPVDADRKGQERRFSLSVRAIFHPVAASPDVEALLRRQ